jgi:methionine-gamma-lyase
MRPQRGLGTRSVHAGEAPDPSTGAHGVPMYQNSTYAFSSHEQLEAFRSGQGPHFTYAPRGNPTVRCLELKLADLEGAEAAVAAASGMAAISSCVLHLVAGGGHIVASTDIYEQTRGFLLEDLPAQGATATLVDFSDLTAVEAAITEMTRAIYAEPFSNPTLRVADLPALAAVAHRHDIPLVVDNTFLSPALLRPIEHGADIVVHSATKYLSGHGQVQGGVICGPRHVIGPVTDKLLRLGGAMSPFAAWMLLAGVKTLPLRLERHSGNAARLAALLHAHPAVATVNYPGLPSHPGHDLARGLLGSTSPRFGGMLSFVLQGGPGAIGPFLNALELCSLAVSLGDVSTLIWPFAGTDLIRLSVGIEDIVDLEADLIGALDRLPVSAAAD